MKSKHEKEKKRKHKSRSRSRSRSPFHEQKSRNQRDSNSSKIPESSGGGGESSLSIEETNKVRAQLGLAPLEVYDPNAGGSENAKKDFTHTPAKNIGELRRADELKEKLSTQKDKRSISSKLSKVKTLGEVDDEDESAASWIEKSRKLAEEKKKAEHRAKALMEMDEAFGVSDLVKQEFTKTKLKRKDGPAVNELEGVKVGHKLSSFTEGSSVILTLDDKSVLDDDEQILVNVNIQDDEKAIKNKELRRIGPNYQAYANLDEEDPFKAPSLLGKYDEVIDGPKMNSFTLNSRGTYAGDHERALERLKQDMIMNKQSLDDMNFKLASDYYTEEEMNAKFKKRKRRVKSTRKTVLTVDDLMPLDDVPTESMDHGSRNRVRKQEEANGDTEMESKWEPADQEESYQAPVESTTKEDYDSDEELAKIKLDPDETDEELQKALAKVRKMQQKKQRSTIPQIEELLERNQSSSLNPSSENDSNDKAMVLNSMTEFCRSIGDFNQTGDGRSKNFDDDDAMDVDEDLDTSQIYGDTVISGGGWQEVDAEPSVPSTFDHIGQSKAGPSDTAVLNDEPQLNQGVACALVLASKKGYIEQQRKHMPREEKLRDIMAQNYVKEDIRYDDIDNKFRKRDRFSGGPVTDFKDKSDYRPDIKLEYVDDLGRCLSIKEAFRQLSHKFHGKGSGKKKTEKRMKKLQEEILMQTMSSSDTPLGTVDKLNKKLENEKQAYVMLSGKQSNMKSLSK